MKTLPLTLRFAEEPAEADAYLLPADSRAALQEVSRWGVPAGEVRFLALPQSIGDLRCRALLAIPPASASPRVSAGVQGYAACAGRLFLPVHARLIPELPKDVLARLLGHDLYVFDTRGLVRFEEQDALRAAALLASKGEVSGDWDMAAPGAAVNRRLASVSLARAPSAEDVFEEVRRQIGSKGWGTLPSVEGASLPRDVLAAVGPHPRLKSFLELMQKNPDQGLEYAPRIGKGGLCLPYMELEGFPFSRHDLDFDWNAEPLGLALGFSLPEVVLNYIKHLYRQAADQAVCAGQCRKAAYILHRLLEESLVAADVLTMGGDYHGAADLYQRKGEHWHQAHCLEKAGQFEAALAKYLELHAEEKAARMCEELQRPEAAREHWENALAQYGRSGDHLACGRILGAKLGRTDEAIEAFVAALLGTRQSPGAAGEAFRMLARLQLARELLELMERLAGEDLSPWQAVGLIECLAEQGRSHADPAVRAAAMAGVMRVATRCLPEASVREAEQILVQIRSLEPNDRLLASDLARFRRRREEEIGCRRRGKPITSGRIRWAGHFSLGSQIAWQCIEICRQQIVALGYRGSQVVLAQGTISRGFELFAPPGWDLGTLGQWPLMLLPNDDSMWAIPFGPIRLPSIRLWRRDHFLMQRFGTPDWFDSHVLGVATGEAMSVRVELSQGKPQLLLFEEQSHYSSKRRSIGPLMDDVPSLARPLPMAIGEPEVLWIGGGDRLVRCTFSPATDVVYMPRPIHCLKYSSEAKMLGVSLSQGAVLVRGSSDLDLEDVAEDLVRPSLALGAGWLTAVSASALQVYRLEPQRAVLTATMDGRGVAPVAALELPQDSCRSLAILYADGELDVWDVLP